MKSEQARAELRGGPRAERAELRAERAGLRADCGNCFGLCCVALPFAKSADFAVDKRAGEACTNLDGAFRCRIHADLRREGFPGCTVFDCFGAGQRVSQVTFGGTDWRTEPGLAGRMFAVFGVVRQLHELLWYLTEALELPGVRALYDELRGARDEVRGLAEGGAEELVGLDVGVVRERVSGLLLRASEMERGGGARKKNRRGADLIGARLRGADLRAANLRGAYLIAADLRGADLRRADVIGADFRDTDLRGADLRNALFLTQSQVDAARVDGSTRLPPGVRWRGER